jgi:hypothetical protein
MERMTLSEICGEIDGYLRRFEADPEVNAPVRWVRDGQIHTAGRPYYNARAGRAGNRCWVSYVSYQHTAHLTRAEAEAYLDWLKAGNVGKHYECLYRESCA